MSNGMILYPTDDEILAFKMAIFDNNYRNARNMSDEMRCVVEAWGIVAWKVVFNLEPLKINETVLG